MPIIEGAVARGAGVERGPGADWYVDVNNGSDSSGGGHAWSDAFATIQHAIDTAAAGDRIWIATGTYDEAVVVDKDNLTLTGGDEGGYERPDIVPSTGKALFLSAAQGVVLRHLRFASTDDSVVHLEGNGWLVEDCVFDGDGNGATDALLLLKGNADDDSYTASEGMVKDSLFRGSGGFGVLFDTGDAPGNGVGSTDCRFENCVFVDNTAADVATADSGGGTYSAQRFRFSGCSFAGPKNKATWLDFTTANGGAAGDQTGVFDACFFNDDNLDGTAVALVGTGIGLVGCASLDGIVDGSALD